MNMDIMLINSLFMCNVVVSRAFQVLSDADKKAKFDRFGGDPDNRFGPGSSAPGASPFSGSFGRSSSSSGRGPMFEDEISPEELFNRFFAGGGGPFGMWEEEKDLGYLSQHDPSYYSPCSSFKLNE